jgi:predicted transcriptional regulator
MDRATADATTARRRLPGVSVVADTVQSIPDSREGGHAIIEDVRQLITRIDDQLHERLKRVAKHESRSVNSLVVESLERTVGERDRPETPQEWKLRMIERGLIVAPHGPPPEDVPSLDELEEISRGWGPVVSEQLDRDRHSD